MVRLLDAARPRVGCAALFLRTTAGTAPERVVASAGDHAARVLPVGPALDRRRGAGAPLPCGPRQLRPPLLHPPGRESRSRTAAARGRGGRPGHAPRGGGRAVRVRAEAGRQLHAVLPLERPHLLDDPGRRARARLPPRLGGASRRTGRAGTAARRAPRDRPAADIVLRRLHVGDRTHVLRATLSALEQRVDPERFRRVNRSALVNLDRVRELQPWFHGDAIVILDRGARLGLSRRYRANLLGTPVA